MQVAINWTICKGAVPIPGAKSARQAKEAAGKNQMLCFQTFSILKESGDLRLSSGPASLITYFRVCTLILHLRLVVIYIRIFLTTLTAASCTDGLKAQVHHAADGL